MNQTATLRFPAAGTATPSRLEWIVAVFAVLVQQGAFISLPLVLSGNSLRATVNPFNTVAVALSMLSLGVFVAPHLRKVGLLARHNIPSLLFIAIVLLSTRWSLYPDITMRRGLGYVLTLALAAYLTIRFDEGARLEILSWSFAISAIGSVLFVVVLPQYGIMHEGDLAGAWRGVFPHKNVLGPIMAVGVFIELYILVRGSGYPRWRFATLAVFASLAGLSQSATAWFLTLFYAAGAGIYLLWRWRPTVALTVVTNCVLAVLAGALVAGRNPAALLGMIGKDATLTGRTTLWDVVVEFIQEKPLLGWGYHAMWVVDDPTTLLADKLTGQWGITGSHNGFLEIALQLGMVGLGVMLAILGIAAWRSVRCCRLGIAPLGWFSLVFMLGAILSSTTMETLGQNQVVEWLVFNVLAFSCSLELLMRRAHYHGISPSAPRRPPTRTVRSRPDYASI